MAAGLGFKNFTTGEVLTAADVNGYLMQGVLVFASEAARDAAITSPQEGQFAFTKDNNSLWYYSGAAWVASGATGDIEGVTAGTGISGGGTSGTVTITNSMATEIDAKGDLVAGTGADAFARLGVGANGTVLTAASGEATGLQWAAPAAAGGLTLIDSTTFSNTLTNYTVSTISGTHKNLLIIGSGLQTSAASSGPIELQFNGDTGSNYSYYGIRNIAGTISSDFAVSYSSIQTGIVFALTGDSAARFGGFQMFINNYASTSLYRTYQNNAFAGAGGSNHVNQYAGAYNNNTTAITSIKFTNATGGNFKAGTIQIYGVN
jgi:hypothetical protein